MGSIIIRDFHEALNAVAQPTRKGPQFADSMLNAIVSTRNAVAKKPGTEPINSSAYASGSEILSIYDFNLQRGSTVRKAIFNAGTDLYEVHLESGAAGVIKSGLSAREFQFEASDKAAYMGNGKDMIKYYAVAGYSLFADTNQILDETNTELAESFISLHGKSRNCASISIPLIRVGAIPSSTKVTIEIQGDSSGEPDGTPITNGTSNQIDGDKLPLNWTWTSFTFGATLPILAADTTYWIVLTTSALLTSGLDIGWGVDASSPDYDDGNFATFNASWTDQAAQVGLFQVFVEPDQWGITAPTTAPSVSGASTNNPAYDTVADQDADEELIDTDSTTASLAQSWQFTGSADRAVSSVQFYLKKTGSPVGDLQVEIRADAGGKPSSSALMEFPVSPMSDLTTSYAFVKFTANDSVILRANTKYWLHLSGSQTYIEEYVAATTSVSWGVDDSSPSFSTGEFARRPADEWDLDSGKDALFRITSSLQLAGGRKYAYSWKNSVTGHVSNRSTGSTRGGNFDTVTVGGFEVPTDPQIDEIVIWATTDGGEIFYLLTDGTANTSSVLTALIGSEASDERVQPISAASAGVDGSYVELIEETQLASTWITVSILQATGSVTPVGQLDIALGESGSEVVLIEDIVFVYTESAVDGTSSMILSFPVAIPAGSRISVRAKDDLGSAVTYNVGITIGNPSLTGDDGGISNHSDGPATDDDLDFTQEAPLDNDPPPAGEIIIRAKESIFVSGVAATPHQAFFSAGLGQTLIGVQDESFPALNLISVPSGAQKISNIDLVDEAPVVFTADRLFSVEGEIPETFRTAPMRGGEGVGSVSKEGSAATEIGLFFMSTDRKIYLIPTINHVPQLASAIIEDELEDIVSDSSLITIASMQKIRMVYLHFGDRHWLITVIPTGATTSTNNEMWVYDIDLHAEHPGRGWMGPLILDGGEGYQSLRIVTDAKNDKKLLIGDDGGFIREFAVGNQDDSANFSASYTFSFMDDGKPNTVKDGLVAEVIVPSGQTIPANFLQVSYDSETNFESIALTQVNEMVRGGSAHKYRGYLMNQFTRIKPKINFSSENAVGELWQLRIDYDDLYDVRGFIHDA